MADPPTEPSVRLFVVGDGPTPDGLARAVAAAGAADGDGTDGTGAVCESVAPAALVDRLAAGSPPTGVVLVGEPALPDDAAAALEAAGVPVVAYGGTEPGPEAAYVDGYVDAGGDADRLARELQRARDGGTRRQLREARRRVTELHDGAAEIAAAGSVAELFERTVAVAERVLSFDHCAVGVAVDGRLVVRERSTDWLPTEVPVEGTLAGRAYRTGETVHVDDVDAMALENTEATGSSVSVPVGDDVVLQALSRRTNAFDATDRELAELLATHLGQAYERLRAQADLTRRERVMSELHEAGPRLVDADDEDDLFALVVEIAENVLSFDRSCVYTADDADDDGRFRRRATTDPTLPEWLPRDFGAMAATLDGGRALLVEDIADSDVAESHDGGSRSLVSVPFAGDAVFQAVTDRAGHFDGSDLEYAELLVSYATATRERIRSEETLRTARRTTERLHVAATELAADDDEGTVIDRAVGAAEDVLAFDKCSVLLREGERLVPVADSEDGADGIARPMGLDEGVAGRTYRTGESSLVGDMTATDDADPARPEYRSGLSVPIGDLGVFQAVAEKPEAFDRDDLRGAELLMAHVAVSLRRVRAQTELRGERDRLCALFENVPDAAVSYELVDGEPVVREVNTAFESVFGFGDEIVGEPVDDYIVPADEETRAEAEALNERLRTGENVRTECRRRTAAGVRDFLLYVVPLELGAANLGGYAIYSDITERRERERALRRQNERLDEFASVVSHDLRNPLSIAEGFLELARETGDDAHLDRVADAVDRMRELVDRLLRLARDGRVVGEVERVDLGEAARLAWGTVDTRGATLDVPEGVTVDADPDRLRDLLENLFRNAVDHGGDDVRVVVEATADGFAVADDGPGVPPDERETAFDVGVTTTGDGTGFGLAIVRRIAEAHGWSVELVGAEGGGARFEFGVGE